MPGGRIVWLASYPKSGNTWVRLLLGHLLGKHEDDEEDSFAPVPGISSSRLLFDFYTGLNSYELTIEEIDRLRPDIYRKLAQRLDDVFFIKTHDSCHRNSDGDLLFPGDCSQGAVYIVRDPMDVAVSFAHHRGDTDYDRTVAKMNDQRSSIGGMGNEQLRQLLGDWSGHYRSWVEQKDMPVLVVRYEDLRADTPAQLQRIIDFIGIGSEQCITSIAEAVEATRFERLQSIEAEKGFQERPIKAERFFRSGRSGEGREKLSPELQNSLISHHRDVMQELGYLTGDYG